MLIAADICVQVLSQALAGFNAMRDRGGRKSWRRICAAKRRRHRRDWWNRWSSSVSGNGCRRTGNSSARGCMEVLANTATIDESRILTEAAIFADKVAVDEETVRLRSHLSQLEDYAGAGMAPWAGSWTF